MKETKFFELYDALPEVLKSAVDFILKTYAKLES